MTERARLSNLRKRRGVVRASLTRLQTRLNDLERAAVQPGTLEAARQVLSKLDILDAEFKQHHLAIVDLTDDENALRDEQTALDKHDDEVSSIGLRTQKLISTCSLPTDADPKKIPHKRLSRLQRALASVSDQLTSLPGGSDGIVLLRQLEEQLSDVKRELGDIRGTLDSLDLEDSDELNELQITVERAVFDCSLTVKRNLLSQTHPIVPPDSKGVKLPKIDVPTFDGNLLHWSTFWEQFDVSVHSKAGLSDAEKLVYLQHALKGGSAKQAIEGLSRSGDHYVEAVECLKDRYNRPRLIHQAHVRMIVDAPSLKDGSGKELRRLHDVVQQHLRALRSLGHDPPGPFITSLLELKLDATTMFEWQRHSQTAADIPHYDDLLKFLNLRAQASESSASDSRKSAKTEFPYSKKHSFGKPVASFVASVDTHIICVACKKEKHPLYACTKFKALNHADMTALVKTNNLCLNCLRPGHHLKDCNSSYRCKRCQRPHHTLLHVESRSEPPRLEVTPVTSVSNHVTMGLRSSVLLMTCRVIVEASNGLVTEARALLDSGSSASFISESLAQQLHLPRSNQITHISGVAGITCNSSARAVTSFKISSIHSCPRKYKVDAVIVSRVTRDLPLHPVSNTGWIHLSGIELADPEFNTPGKIDLLLGVETFAEVMGQGRRTGSPGMPVAFETCLGWVLAGSVNSQVPTCQVAVHHASLLTGDDLIRKFWEVEERSPCTSDHTLSLEERTALEHFKTHHSHLPDGRFIVPLPRKPNVESLGESRSQAVRRFQSFERSLRARGQFREFEAVINEYFEAGHAEEVPTPDLEKGPQEVFYLPMHSVRKESSTTTKIRAVFDASAKTSTGISFNDTLLVGPTVHSSLIDVLLRFRLHRVALTADVSRMYRAIALAESDKDLHRFVWRAAPQDKLKDFRMTRVTFGVSASSFIANMCVKQNALDHALQYPLAAKAVKEAFYVDDGVTGADSVEEAIELQRQLQSLFSIAGFLLRKWNSSEVAVLQHINPDLRDSQPVRHMSDPEAEYTKTLGIEWNASSDYFRLTVAKLPSLERITKRSLVADIARIFDVLGWYSPIIILVKILLQRLWEEKIEWDDPVPPAICQVWSKWRDELQLLSAHYIPRCYFPKNTRIQSMQLHGFSDASQSAYAGVVYLRMVDECGEVHISLVISKTKVAPIKRLTIPRLELCGALLLAQLLHHCKTVFALSSDQVFAWTDSTIVLNWLIGSPRRFKVYVANRISHIVELVSPEHWRHVEGVENPADCASRGLFPAELLKHTLWWSGPNWLRLSEDAWPKQTQLAPNSPSEERDELCHHLNITHPNPIISIDHFSSFTRLKRVTAWVMRFIRNCRDRRKRLECNLGPLTVKELTLAESYWISLAQREYFAHEIEALKAGTRLPLSSSVISLSPYLDKHALLRVGGREQNSNRPYDSKHPIIVHARHPVAKLLVRSEHIRLLHAGPSLLSASLSRRFHLIRGRNLIRSVTRSCVTCRYKASRPRPQMMGQLPSARVTPDAVFNTVGVDYAGPVYIKTGPVRRPIIVKAYVAVFVSLSVKAVHLEAVSDLTSEAFLACLRRFTARRGKPALMWSDHGTNFIGANRLITELYQFLRQQETEEIITNFCTSQGIVWDFIPEHAPHFGGLWEAAVKSMKRHLFRIVGNARLNFEELSTVLSQIEACLNSRPLVSLPSDDDGVEALTPGHFLIGRPLEAIPDHPHSHQPISLLRRWHLCQSLVRHFWQRWSSEYLTTLQKIHKWHSPSRNITVGDIIVLKEDGIVPNHWPLARVIKTHPGRDGMVRVITVKTRSGNYTRPVTKAALLLPSET